MKPQGSHAHEDRLLDFAYEELPPSEARVVEQHVQGCTRCSQTLEGIRGVRTTMARLSEEAAPDTGLDSLLAYAQQSARRAAAGPAPAPRWWRRLLAPALGVAALSVFGVVVVHVNRDVDLSPAFRKEAALKPAPVPAPAEVVAKQERYDAEVREPLRALPSSKKPMSADSVRRQERAQGADSLMGSAGGFPEKKTAMASGESGRGVGSLDGWESAKRKAGGAPSKSAAIQDFAAQDKEASSTYVQNAEPVAKKDRTSASRAASEQAESADDEFDERISSPVQVTSAAPPPPPPTTQSTPPSGAAAGPSPQARGLSLPEKEERSQQPQEAPAMRKSPSSAELLRQADIAYRSGNRAEEVAFLRAVLGAGAQGSQLVQVLSRLCEAESALGHQQNAIEVCKRVVQMAPGSSEARVAQRYLDRELQSPADEATSKPAAPVRQ